MALSKTATAAKKVGVNDKLQFGKYASLTINEILARDLQYVMWVHNNVS